MKFSKTDAYAAIKVEAIANGAQSTFCGTHTELSTVRAISTLIPITAEVQVCENSTITVQAITLSPVIFNKSES